MSGTAPSKPDAQNRQAKGQTNTVVPWIDWAGTPAGRKHLPLPPFSLS